MVRLNSNYLIKLEGQSKTRLRPSNIPKNDDILNKTENSSSDQQNSISKDTLNKNGDSLHKERKRREKERETKSANITEEESELLNTKTHLHLQRKGITHIDDLKACRRVRFLFLQENSIRRIGHLRHLHRLQELYLHDNNIIRIEGMRHLGYLRKLFIPRNNISVLENLPPNLEVLDVRDQHLMYGDSIILDAQSMFHVQSTLKLLDISSNRLTDIYAVSHLKNLQILRASNNLLDDHDHVTSIVSQLPHLTELDLRRNPISCFRKYKVSIIQNSNSLRILDDREISSEERISFLNLKTRRKRVSKAVPKSPRNLDTSEEKKKPYLLFYGKVVKETSVERKFILGALRNPDFDAFLLAKQTLILSTGNNKETNLPELINKFESSDALRQIERDSADEETQPEDEEEEETANEDAKENNEEEMFDKKNTINLDSTTAV